MDVFDWILSPEIREFWRKNYRPTVMERLALIRGAHRPMEERLDALCALLKEAETRRERQAVSEDIRLFRYVLREIYDTRPGQFFLLRHPCFTQKPELTGWGSTGVFAAFSDMLDDQDVKSSPWKDCGFLVQKWDMTGKVPEELFTFDLRSIDDKLAITTLYMDPAQRERAGVSRKTPGRSSHEVLGRHPYALPFFTGQLVKLDAPMFKSPVFGVLYSEDDLNGSRYIFLGCIQHCCRGGFFHTLDLSCQEIDVNGCGFRVIDWLHHTTPAELPRGQEILGDISLYLRRLRRKGWLAAEKLFFRIFDPAGEPGPWHVTPVTLSELLHDDKITCGRWGPAG